MYVFGIYKSYSYRTILSFSLNVTFCLFSSSIHR